MKRYEPKDIRTIAIIGHGGSGKTSVGEALLFLTGANNRLGAVDDETALLDYEPEEHKRRGSIATSFGTVEWNDVKINFADTPGDGNFIMDSRAAMLGVDSAVSVISAVDGVEVNTERTFGYAGEAGVPVAVFINKMDRERADGQQVADDVAELLGVRAVPLQVPVGAESNFKGVCDLLSGKLLTFATDGSGKVTEGPIPADLQDEVDAATEVMVEAAAEADEELLEKYLEEGELSTAELKIGLLAGIHAGSFLPVVFGSATLNFGIASLLDLMTMLPTPLDAAARTAHDGDDEVQIGPESTEKFAGLVIKTINDPFTGKLTIFRVMRGGIDADTNVYNSTREGKERFGQIFHLLGKKTVSVGHAVLGDIVAVAKLKDTRTFDTLTAGKSELQFQVHEIPPPMITYIVRPKSKGDEDKIKGGLTRLIEEDPSLSTGHDELTSSIIIAGMGQIHIDMAVEQLRRKYGVGIEMELPPVPYKETIRGSVRIQGRHKKQTGGRGQFGDTWQRISPLPRGVGFEFKSE
ncbi:MAG: GTP-binding protein, partial [Deltaproteobacteria bacterium]|nr:GTP-binding protein [Deltaproteobacteria bacterium]